MGAVYCCRECFLAGSGNADNVQSTLKFINEEGISVHGCIRASSIFTSQSGEWRLGGLDILSSMKEDDAVIFVCTWLDSLACYC